MVLRWGQISDNNIEENYSIFSLIQTHYAISKACVQ